MFVSGCFIVFVGKFAVFFWKVGDFCSVLNFKRFLVFLCVFGYLFGVFSCVCVCVCFWKKCCFFGRFEQDEVV